jgi:seryl-tRNA synthetase
MTGTTTTITTDSIRERVNVELSRAQMLANRFTTLPKRKRSEQDVKRVTEVYMAWKALAEQNNSTREQVERVANGIKHIGGTQEEVQLMYEIHGMMC